MDLQSTSPTKNRNFLSISSSSAHGMIGNRGVYGIQQRLKALKQANVDISPSPSDGDIDSDNNNSAVAIIKEDHKMMNGVNNNHGESELLDLKIKGVGYSNGNGNHRGTVNGNGIRENGGDEEEEEYGTNDYADNGRDEEEEEEDDGTEQQKYNGYNRTLIQQHLLGLQQNGGVDEDDDQVEYREEDGGEEEEDYYPDISEYLTTQIDGVGDDEEDRGVPRQQSLSSQHGVYYEEEDDEVDITTAQLLNSLPPCTLIQQTSAPKGSKSSSSTSARTNTLLNNFLLRNNINHRTNGSARGAANSQQQYKSMVLEDDEEEGYYDEVERNVPLALIVQQAKLQAQQAQQQVQKRPAMNKSRNIRSSTLSTSALLEQLQSPAFSKPNILSRKLMGLPAKESTNSRPPPRLQPRPSHQRPYTSSSPQQNQINMSLESILRKQVSPKKPVPRLQNLTTTSSRSSATAATNYIIDGRKLSFKTGINNSSIMKQQQMPKQKSPTRSLESLMLNHQRSTQLQQQLSSGRNLRGEAQEMMIGNLHIRQVSQPQQRSSATSLLRNRQQQLPQRKNVPKCHICDKPFATNQVLQRHISSVHGVTLPTGDGGELKISASIFGGAQQQQQNSSSAHRCRVCYRTFGSLENLRAHSLNHEGDFKCRACRRGFPSLEVLEQHEATHKKYECRWCTKYFMNSGNLKAHERIHTGERPYKCADCPKGFKQLGGLQYHLKTNPTHRPQKYKLEDQEQDNNTPQDFSLSMLLGGQEDNSGDGNNSYPNNGRHSQNYKLGEQDEEQDDYDDGPQDFSSTMYLEGQEEDDDNNSGMYIDEEEEEEEEEEDNEDDQQSVAGLMDYAAANTASAGL